MKLSIVIIFCDKDRKYLEDFLKNTEEKVICEHEIILVDNRNDKTEKIDLPYKIIVSEKDCHILEGRRLGLDEVTGEYVWFVDVDDEILNGFTEEDLKDRHETILQLNYKVSGKAIIECGEVKNNLKCFGVSNWSRLYKAEKLKKFFKPIKRGLLLNNGEDNLIFCAMMEAREYERDFYIFQDKYRYNYITSCSAVGENRSPESIKRAIIGGENFDYLFSFIKDEKEREFQKKALKKYNKQLKDNIKGEK